LLKADTTRTLDPIRPTIGGHDPNRPTNGSKQGGYDLGVFVRGVFDRTPPGTIGDSITEFNRILCTSKYEAVVIGNKKNFAVGMLKLTTDIHEASRGLSATAELLVRCAILAKVSSFKLSVMKRRRGDRCE